MRALQVRVQRLQVADLSNPGVVGSIPAEIGDLHNFRHLNLSDNPMITGAIPEGIVNLRQLLQRSAFSSRRLRHYRTNSSSDPTYWRCSQCYSWSFSTSFSSTSFLSTYTRKLVSKGTTLAYRSLMDAEGIMCQFRCCGYKQTCTNCLFPA
uniref:Uncharacterized protein n=1 Tax=Physcomitrium patens TaxID=3218 RepID=A0A2K1L7T6_PHYPA|nr:hypothetical protein PHYPA_000520 [Physcomitrium patens]